MMAMKCVFAVLAVAIGIFGAKAEQTDSVSAAYAAVWGEYVVPHIRQEYRGDSIQAARYMDGIQAAMSLNPADESYYEGILEGFMIAGRIRQMQRMQIPVDEAGFIEALKDIVAGKDVGFTRESADEYLSSYVSRNMRPDTVSTESQEAFLAKQRERKSVVVTPSGLHFEVLSEGVGETPQSTDRVTVKYVGRLADGDVFDSTDEPVTFDVNRLVSGFSEGLMMMKPGGRYRIFIPASLGYGERGVEGVIPGNSVLDFEVELIGIEK